MRDRIVTGTRTLGSEQMKRPASRNQIWEKAELLCCWALTVPLGTVSEKMWRQQHRYRESAKIQTTDSFIQQQVESSIPSS